MTNLVTTEPALPTRNGLRESRLYLVSVLLTMAAVTEILRLWRATWSIPFSYSGDAVAAAARVRTILQTGWDSTQPHLGFPYGQHNSDHPSSDDLHPVLIKVLGLFTHSWPVVFNLYYVLGYPLAAITALWFLRRCGLSGPMAVVLSVLYAVAPYHLLRNQAQLFLGEYFPVPLALGVVLTVVRGQPLWGARRPVRPWGRFRPVVAVLSGRGAGTVAVMALITLDSVDYGVFTAVLLGAAGLLALFRTRDRRRFAGVVAAGGVLVVVTVAAKLPDIVHAHQHGSDAAAFARVGSEAERYALKLTSLVIPAPGHPIPGFARIREFYDSNYPYPSEDPALGLIATAGFVILLLVLLRSVLGRPARTTPDPTVRHLSVLAVCAFLAGTVGGLGTLVSLVTPDIRGWNRISIFIALLALAGFGLVLESGLRRLGERTSARSPVIMPVVAALVLVVGVADQSISQGRPDYTTAAAAHTSDQHFVAALQTRLPVDATIFQLPYLAFPESPALHGEGDADQLKLFLHSDTLRWSGGGIRGRPQTDWPAAVSAEPPDQLVRDLAIVGFAGIVVDRDGTSDHGRQLEAALTPFTGAPAVLSPDGRWSFLSLQHAGQQVAAQLSAEERAAAAAKITRAAG